jgi:membrane fusion protein (multidrug efflux system)
MRTALIVLGLLALVLLLGAVKGAQIGTLVRFGKEQKKLGPPPETVTSYVAESQTWEKTVASIGNVATARGVSISNDAAGLVARITFDSGESVKKGQVLVELDSRVERAQLASALARQDLAHVNANRTRSLFSSESVAKQQLDSDESVLTSANADSRALEAQIERKVVRAPFDGKLGIRLVNAGQYLAAGTPIVTLESSEPGYVDFSLPQEDLGLVAIGTKVRVRRGDAKPAEAIVSVVEPSLDAKSRNVKVRATMPADGVALRPGMFVDVTVVEPQPEQVVAVPQTAIVHAAFGDSVFVVENGAVRQQFVHTGSARGDFVAIAKGVTAGQEVVAGGAFKLRNGMRVTVNNAVAPQPELAPHPENR